MTKPLSLLTALALACPLTARADEPFVDMTFKAAKKAAREQNKSVFIDFYTTWCGPCKMLDATTWKDEKVRAWLKEHTIPLKIDAEKERELAGKFAVSGYPTLLFLKPDGSEADRLVGYRDAETFLSEANDILAGKDSLARAKEKLEGNENNPMERMKYAQALQQQGKHKEALEEYLWCFDHGLEYGWGFHGVRLSFLLSDIQRLGKVYPPAIDALKERRDAAGQSLLKGLTDGKNKKKTRKDWGNLFGLFGSGGPDGAFLAAQEFSAINRTLGEEQKTLALFDEMPKQGANAALARSFLFDQVFDLLLEAKRYDDIVAEVDPFAKLDENIEMFEMTRDLARRRPAPPGFDPVDPQKRQVITEGAKHYEALLGVGKKKDARTLADKLLAFEKSARTYATLIRRAARAGAFDTARRHALKAESVLNEADLAEVRKAAKEVPGEI